VPPLLTIASVIKPPAPGFDKTRQSLLREFAGCRDVEWVIKIKDGRGEIEDGRWGMEDGGSATDDVSLGTPEPGSEVLNFQSSIFNLQSPIREIRADDTGVFDGMNQAVAAAKGEWILFLNAGDWLAKGMGKALRNALVRHDGADFLYFDGVTVDAADGREFLRRAPDVLTLRDFRHRAPVLHPCLVVRRALLEAAPFDLRHDLAADFDLMVRLVAQGRRGVRVALVGAFVVSGGLSEQGRLRARWQAARSQLRHGRGIGHALGVLAAHARFLVMHALIVGLVRRIPALRRRARARSGGRPAGTYAGEFPCEP
jgi:hypothetical protein